MNEILLYRQLTAELQHHSIAVLLCNTDTQLPLVLAAVSALGSSQCYDTVGSVMSVSCGVAAPLTARHALSQICAQHSCAVFTY